MYTILQEEHEWCETDTYRKLKELANEYMLARAI